MGHAPTSVPTRHTADYGMRRDMRFLYLPSYLLPLTSAFRPPTSALEAAHSASAAAAASESEIENLKSEILLEPGKSKATGEDVHDSTVLPARMEITLAMV